MRPTIDRVLHITFVLALALSLVPVRAAEPQGGPQEGIKVHGRWTIVVREADGRDVARREFDNALLPDGAGFLARLLARQVPMGEWAVQLLDSSGNPCGVFYEPTSSQSGGPGVAKTLTASFIGGSTGAGTVQLKGDMRAATTCDIAQVATAILNASGTGSMVTGAKLASVINVPAGRLIEVTVMLSFS